MTYEEYMMTIGVTCMYPYESLHNNIPDNYYWKPMVFQGEIKCYVLTEKEKDCGCRKFGV